MRQRGSPGSRLARLRWLTQAALLAERAWPALWPALGVAGGFLCVALLDLPRRVPAALHAVALAAVALAALALLWRGLRALRLPDRREADRRLEQQSGLPHRPLAVLADRPALGGADPLWRAHVARALAQVDRLRPGLPRPAMAAHDPRALRALVLLGLVASLVIAGEEAPSRLSRALRPNFAPPAALAATEVQGWITPPGYTNLPPVFLRPAGGAVSVPAGSHLTVSLSGGSGAPALSLGAAKLVFQPVDAGSFQADADLTEGGRLSVSRHGAELAGWDVSVTPDRSPVARWVEPPGAAKGGGRVPSTRLPWQVSHDYGVTALQAEIRLHQRPDAPPLVVAIPLPGGAPKSAKGVRAPDLTAHPWAGLAVSGRLVARDAAGLSGASEDAEFTLPQRRFDNPTARALIEVRKTLSLFPDERGPPLGELDRLAVQEGVWERDLGGFLNLRALTNELAHNRDPAAVEEVQSSLWQLALHLEEGGTDQTNRAITEARRALRELMEAQRRGEKVDPAEMDKRIAALEKAIEQHLQALAEQLRRDPDAQLGDPEQRRIDANDARKLAEQLREAERQGRPQDAEQRMAELEKLLDQLQAARPQHRDAQQRQKAQKRQRGEQQMSVLQDLIQRQGGVLDHAQTRQDSLLPPPDARQRRPPDPARPEAERPDPASPQATDQRAAERQADQRVQQALRMALGELMQQYGDLTGEVPANLGDADRAMREAGQALGQSRDRAAAGAAQAAIEALQKGGQAMSEQLAQQFGAPGSQGAGEEEGDQEGDQPGPGIANGEPQDGDAQGDSRGGNRPWASRPGQGRRGQQRTDPLGRPLKDGNGGADEAADVTLPEQAETARTRAIQDELRRRGAERGRPQPELDYIDRLLKQF